MTTAMLEDAVRRYLDALRAQLDDVPAEERDDLMEDLEQHLQEVAAEDDGSLEERLGTPDLYAEELRASIGLPLRDLGMVRTRAERRRDYWRRSTIGRAFAAVYGSKTVRAFRAFLPELRPGWWVLRGYIAFVAPQVAASDPRGRLFFPRTAQPLLALLAVGFVVWLSVALGRRSDSSSRARRISLVANTLVPIIALIALANEPPSGGASYPASFYLQQPSYLRHEDRTPIANICAYAADGTPLHGVLLFDQDGVAITNTAPALADGTSVERVQPAIPNAYPHALREARPYGFEDSTTIFSCPTVRAPAASVKPSARTKSLAPVKPRRSP